MMIQTGIGQTALTAPTAVRRDPIHKLVLDLLDTLHSDHSRAAYHLALDDFLIWHRGIGAPALSKAIVERYRADLAQRRPERNPDPKARLSAATINLRLSAVRGLVHLAAETGAMDELAAERIAAAQNVKSTGKRSGHWLTAEQAQALVRLPDVATLRGLRDRAVLAVLIGTGLRRAELAGLTFAHIQQRQGRWVIVDLVGKRGVIRSVPMPRWARAAVAEWTKAAGLAPPGVVFYSVTTADRVGKAGLSPQTMRDIVRRYGQELGLPLAPHDLRRTFAKLARAGGSPLEQIQLSLGHASIQTTDRYLNSKQDFDDAPGDRLGLGL